MNVVLLTPVRLLGESLASSLMGQPGILSVEIATSVHVVHELLRARPCHVVLVDISQIADDRSIRELAAEWPSMSLLAFGLEEQSEAIVRCGRSGFTSYVPRDAGLEVLRRAVLDCGNGRLHCPAEISAELMRALFFGSALPDFESADELTNRQEQVVALIRRGFSNKEIARELDLSVATVKHHVHNILEKLNLPRRMDVVCRTRPVALKA
ncbi:MAG TPA: response regulator transcription factor [Povalibacter sp.]|uniref:response regulator transcription factor n=1 Tax=Povalibacter sp. TaxID=1962978 RepID=UPI002CA1B4B0|nr:response regulator transcription factor [Povalibacter sp.]HMN44649.1 response regulator transcription factor [Povalibacter sp.]